jgi:plasmid maintenance system antidote protein VapI
MADHPRQPNAAELFSSRGLNNTAVGVLGNIHTSTVGRIVKGEVRARPETIVALARALGVDPRRMRRLCDAHYLAAHPDEAPSAPEQEALKA